MWCFNWNRQNIYRGLKWDYSKDWEGEGDKEVKENSVFRVVGLLSESSYSLIP